MFPARENENWWQRKCVAKVGYQATEVLWFCVAPDRSGEGRDILVVSSPVGGHPPENPTFVLPRMNPKEARAAAAALLACAEQAEACESQSA